MWADRLFRRMRMLAVLGSVVFVGALALSATGAQAATQRLVISPGVNPVRANAGSEGFTAVSCASANLCAAMFNWGSGDLAISTDPAAGAASWKLMTLPVVQSLSSIDCVSARLCLAGDDSGYVWISTDPAGGYSKWRLGPRLETDVDTAGLNGLSCPTAGLCVITDEQGSVSVTSDPTGPASAWHHFTVPYDTSQYTNDPVVCSSASFCWMKVSNGDVYTTTTPLSGGWQKATSTSGYTVPNPLISCPTSSLCVKVGYDAQVSTASSAAGPWTAGTVTGWSPLTGAVCSKVGRCIAVDEAGNVLGSSPLSPAAGSTAAATGVKWGVSHIGKVKFAGGLACPQLSLCFAGVAGGVAVSSKPTATGSWRVVNIAAVRRAKVNAVGCASSRLCVAVTSSGAVLSSTLPNGAGSSWKLERKLTPLPIEDGNADEPLSFATCPNAHLCFAGAPLAQYQDGVTAGMFLWSTQPTKPSSWHGAQLGFGGVSCPAANLCLAEAAAGSWSSSIVFSRNPTGGKKAWHPIAVNGFYSDVNEVGQPGSTIACASSHLCVALGQNSAGDGAIAVSTTPTKPGSWKVQTLTGAALTSVYCNSGQCVVSSSLGELFYARVR